ncbi:MAG: esterase family protein [Thermoanaerobaculia bacterium]|nr:esterase family protein [Thermoanaerobaculia bacterium]
MHTGIQPRQVQHDYSRHLHRHVTFDIYLPPDYEAEPERHYPLLLFNDGQDLATAGLGNTLYSLIYHAKIRPVVAVGVYAGRGRRHEYGTTRQADYKGRGDKAPHYRDFILDELLPYLREKWRLSVLPEDNVFAGFSLGGLSAFDIAWAHPEIFGAAGVFSGSLWWRWADVDPADPDACRIIHDVVRTSTGARPNAQRFWFQAGALDETEDRNNNGIIDAIDDTLHLIEALKSRGYPDQQIRYLQMEDGAHDPLTWGRAMPDFLRWMFPY